MIDILYLETFVFPYFNSLQLENVESLIRKNLLK